MQKDSELAETLFESGNIAFESENYKETIRYFSRSQKEGLNNVFKVAEANRKIGLSYLALGNKIYNIYNRYKAKKYLRLATKDGLFFQGGVLALAQSEEKQSYIIKWAREESIKNKVNELYDWYSAIGSLDENSLVVALERANRNEEWGKVFNLSERLIIIDEANVTYRMSLALAADNLGDFSRAYAEVENMFNNMEPLDEMLALRAELNFVVGNFAKAKDYYVCLQNAANNELQTIIKTIDLCIRADKSSKEFHNDVVIILIKWHQIKIYTENIESVDHFELILNAISTFFEFHVDKQNAKTQKLKDDANSQYFETRNSLPPNVDNLQSKSSDATKALTPLESHLNNQKQQIKVLQELQKYMPTINTAVNIEFVDEIKSRTDKLRSNLRTRVWLYQALVTLIKWLLFILLSFSLVDGVYGAATGGNLLGLVFPNLTTSVSNWKAVSVSLLWLFALLFVDEVLIDKINNFFVKLLRNQLREYMGIVSISLVTGLSVQTILESAQPIPNPNFDTQTLLEYGLNDQKMTETREAALDFAFNKATQSDIIPHEKRLMELLNSDEEILRFASAKLLAVGQRKESIPVLMEMLKSDDERTFQSSLISLGKLDLPESLDIVRDYGISHLDDIGRTLSVVEALKFTKSDYGILKIVEIIENCVKNNSPRYDCFFDALENKGDVASFGLIKILSENENKISFREEWFEAILATGSISGREYVRGNQHIDLFSLGMLQNTDILKSIAYDKSADIEKRKESVIHLAAFEKENIQDLFFELWGTQKDRAFIEILGDIGSEECVAELDRMLNKNRISEQNWIIDLDYIHIFVSLMLSGDNGISVLQKWNQNGTSSKPEKLFSLISLFGLGYCDAACSDSLKVLIKDKSLTEHFQSHALDILFWYFGRKSLNDLKVTNRTLPTPKSIINFFEWVETQNDLPDGVREVATRHKEHFIQADKGSVLFIPEIGGEKVSLLSRVKSWFTKNRN